jgi:hypothetical protein
MNIDKMLKTGWAKLFPWDDRYAATKCGRIFSRALVGTRFHRNRFSNKWRECRYYKPTKRPLYYKVGVANKIWRVHNLIAMIFLGPRPKGLCIRHLDGDNYNNKIENLTYGTPQENSNDAKMHGRYPIGAKHYRSSKNPMNMTRGKPPSKP